MRSAKAFRRPVGIALVAMVSSAIISWLCWSRDEVAPSGMKSHGERPQCGHWALTRAANLLGVPLTVTASMRLLPSNPAGHSFLELRSALRTKGIEARGRSESFESFLAGEFPAIVHLKDPDHFVVAIRTDKGVLTFFDGAGRRARIPIDGIRERWTGNLLRLTRVVPERSSAPAAPRMQFDTLYIDQGNIPRGQEDR